MIDVTASVDVRVSAEQLFAFIADMANNRRCIQGQVRCEWTTPPPIGGGSQYEQPARFLR